MISNVDIQDWQMLTVPLKLQTLKEGDLFSVLGSDKIFKLMCVANEIAFAENAEIFNAFALPRFMEVFQWKPKTK
jgi:hypothetical protein